MESRVIDVLLRANRQNNMNKVGKFGEDIACRFLMKHGFSILERNYTKKWGELDIVAKKDGDICFVEVKTVQGSVTHVTGYRPEENMNQTKIKKFLRIIQTYLIDKKLGRVNWRMALIAVRVDMSTKRAKVRLIDDLIL